MKSKLLFIILGLSLSPPAMALEVCPNDDNGTDYIQCPQTYEDTPGFKFITEGKKMLPHARTARKSKMRRDTARRDGFGASVYHEVKRYDGEGKLIETIPPDKLMSKNTNFLKRQRLRRGGEKGKALATHRELDKSVAQANRERKEGRQGIKPTRKVR
jgi:hypothetical protein